MRVEVFDDKFSLIHFLLGLAITLANVKTAVLACFIFYVMFEILEHFYKYPSETHEHFLGDIIEFMFGAGFGYIVSMLYRIAYGW
jgi:hypothetical protein